MFSLQDQSRYPAIVSAVRSALQVLRRSYLSRRGAFDFNLSGEPRLYEFPAFVDDGPLN